jgi:hypothetical protein
MGYRSSLWKDHGPYKTNMKPYFGYGYIKMCRKRNKTHVAYMDKMGKQSKLPQTITFILELIFEKTNSRWKGIEEEKPYTHP